MEKEDFIDELTYMKKKLVLLEKLLKKNEENVSSKKDCVNLKEDAKKLNLL